MIPAALLLALPFLALVVPYAVVVLSFDALMRLWLTARFRREFVPRGFVGILVYSNSPNWQSHIEAEVIPQFNGHLATVNWSERSTWNRSSPLPCRLFRRLKPAQDFNPAGFVVAAKGGFDTVPLRPGYLALKHGNGDRLKSDLSRLKELVDAAVARTSRVAI